MKKFLSLAGGLLLATGAMAQTEAPEALYLVGSFSDWKVPADGGTDYALTDEDGDGVYSGEFQLSTESMVFKVFDSADAGWSDLAHYFGATLRNFKVFSDKAADVVVWNNQVGEYNVNVTNWVAGGTLKIDASLVRNEEEAITGVKLVLSSDTQPAYTEEREPATALWVVGNVQGWDINWSNLTFEMVEDQVFEGTFNFPFIDGYNGFRFYTELGNWAYGSVGSGVPEMSDEIIELDLKVGEPVTMTCDYGQGNWKLPADWAGAPIKIRVDLNKMEVTFERQEEQVISEIYLIGSLQGWDINSDALKLERVDSKVYEGQFDVESGSQFRFYTELGNWETNSIGSQLDDAPIEIESAVTELLTPVTVDCVWGKGTWKLTEWPGDKLNMRVDLNAMTVTFTRDDGSVVEGIEFVADEAPVYYDLLGSPVSNPGKGLYIRVAGGKAEKVAL